MHIHLLHVIDSAQKIKDFLVCCVCHAPDTLVFNWLLGSISGHIKSQIHVSCRNLGTSPIRHLKAHIITWLVMEYANQTHTHTSPVIRQPTPKKLSGTFDVNNVPQTILTLLSIFIITQEKKTASETFTQGEDERDAECSTTTSGCTFFSSFCWLFPLFSLSTLATEAA